MARRTKTKRNFVLCLLGTFVLFLAGSAAVVVFKLPKLPSSLVPRTLDQGTLVFELSLTLTLVISLIAIPIGFGFMYFFGGLISPRVIRFYLYVTRGKHIVLPKPTEMGLANSARGVSVKFRRQGIYFAFILAVVVSFATYLARRREPILAPIGRPSDLVALLAGDLASLTMYVSLIIPVVALALPYFGGLRLRSIDVGPFHTTVLTTTVGVSGGFALLYSLLTHPLIENQLFYFFLFIGVSWAFAVGCNLAADPANRHIVQEVYLAKPNSRLLPSKIWLEFPPGKLMEI